MTDAERDALLNAGRSAMRQFLSAQTVLEGADAELDLSISAAAQSAANAAAAAILQ
jgi:hypothetical protein